MRRRLKYQISDNIINKFYFKYIRATTQERKIIINTLLQAFEDERLSLLPKPLILLLQSKLKAQETRHLFRALTPNNKVGSATNETLCGM